MRRRVVYSARAQSQLWAMFLELAGDASDESAFRIVLDLQLRLGILADFPYLGRAREDIAPGIRTLAFDRKVLVAYGVAKDLIRIVGIFRRGEDFETALRRPES
jgi:toxin ParE1/3/4